MNSTKPEQLRKRLRRNDQQGFTLIELLVVISILGILAAVVTMSLVGITTRAQTQANSTELRTVQTALDTMLQDPANGAESVGTACPAGPANNMQNFPNGPVHLYPGYIHQQTTTRSYSCDQNGLITGS